MTPPSADGQSTKQHTRVLIVDDEDDLRLMLRLALPAARFTVIAEAADGAEALQKVALETPDLIVLDLDMPDVDGWTALPKLRQHCPDAVIVLWSHERPEPRPEIVLGRGADAFLDKRLPIAEALRRLAALATEHSAT